MTPPTEHAAINKQAIAIDYLGGSVAWSNLSQSEAFSVDVIAVADESGGFWAYCGQLDGVFGEGETAQEAIDDLLSAMPDLLRAYLDDFDRIPWRSFEERGAEQGEAAEHVRTPVVVSPRCG